MTDLGVQGLVKLFDEVSSYDTGALHFPHTLSQVAHLWLEYAAVRADETVEDDNSVLAQFVAFAFLSGIEFQKRGLTLTPCTCASETAAVIERWLRAQH